MLQKLTLSVALLLCLSFIAPNEGANILGVFTSASPSHLIVHMSLVKALAEKGHNITVISCIEPKIKHANIRVVVIPPSAANQQMWDAQIVSMSAEEKGPLQMVKHFLINFIEIIHMQGDMLKDEAFAQFYESSKQVQYDLLIVGYFMNDFVLGLAQKFNCPMVVCWTSEPNDITNGFIGNPSAVTTVPNMNVVLKPGERMGIVQRFKNLMMSAMFKLIFLYTDTHFQAIYNELYGAGALSLADMRNNVSLVFCNSHYSEGKVRANVPALVEIGGIQIKEKPNALPKDLADFLDNAKDGAILFSMGSNLQANTMPAATLNIIFKVFSQLKQRVIIKWNDMSNLPSNASNLKYSKWLPQDDVLAHPNLKLFVTHAGKGGMAEAQYHGVPMVALPAFADQHSNGEHIVASSFGLQVDLSAINEQDFRNAVVQVLENPIYAQSIKQFSQLYRDRPMTAQQSVVYWSEYVMRHRGAKHMQSPLVHMNFIQSYNLDVFILFRLGLFALFFVLKRVYKFAKSKICKDKTKSKQTVKSGKTKLKKN